jgi:hypothetical protein
MERFARRILLLFVATMLVVATSHAQSPSTPTPTQAPSSQAAPPQTSQPAIAPPMLVRVETIPTIELKSVSGGLSIKDFAPSIGALIGLIGALAAVWMSARNNQTSIEAAQKSNQAAIEVGQRNTEAAIMAGQRNNEATLWQKTNETELKDIQAKLDGFYGPFLQLSAMNALLALEMRNRQPDKETFRLLKSVFDKQWLASLSEGDKTIVREICDNADILEDFMKEKTAMVDTKVLPYLSRVRAHFRVLHLAYKGELGTDPTNFLRYVYPWQLDNVLELEVERLQRRIDVLQANPGKCPGHIKPLDIPPKFALPDWPKPERKPLQ